MVKIKTNDLAGTALDYAVAVCEGEDVVTWNNENDTNLFVVVKRFKLLQYPSHYDPSSNWSLAGPIIEREEIAIYRWTCEEHRNQLIKWKAEYPSLCIYAKGDTYLIAAMRCYVASKLGDEVEIPNELIEDK